VVSHDRYFLERVCDVTYALLGDGSCVLLPGGVDQYLDIRHAAERAGSGSGSGSTSATAAGATTAPVTDAPSPAETRQARKDLARIESQLAKLERRIAKLHEQMAETASDYGKLAELQQQLTVATTEQTELEDAWLASAETLD